VSASPDEILARQLEKLAARASEGEAGAGVVRWVARKLPTDAFTVVMHFDAGAEAVLRAAAGVLQSEGRIQDHSPATSEAPAITALVGSGFLNLNPALVTIEVVPEDGNRVAVNVTGMAKEGLIKQHAGEKAAKRVAGRLQGMFSQAADRLGPLN
jgi:hypothetical protein